MLYLFECLIFLVNISIVVNFYGRLKFLWVKFMCESLLDAVPSTPQTTHTRKTSTPNNSHQIFSSSKKISLEATIESQVRDWKTMEPPSRHIHSRSLPLESAEKLPNMSSCIQDMTYFEVFLADDSGGKSCHLFLLFYY